MGRSERVDGTVVRFPGQRSAPAKGGSRSTSASPAEAFRLTPPRWMSSSGAAAFRRIVRHFNASAPGWLVSVDADLLALACEHLAAAVAASKAMRKGPGGSYLVVDADHAHGGRERKHPAHQVFREATAAYLTSARELGLTPKARAELEVGFAEPAGAEDVDDDGEAILDG